MADNLLSEVEITLKERYGVRNMPTPAAVPSTAKRREQETRVDQLLLPDDERPKIPLTKDNYLVKENPQLVLWEREVRKFLRALSPQHEHRVAAVMIYEWATGLPIKEHMRLEKEGVATPGATTWRADIRKINRILRYYFGDPYMTYIANRKVPNAFKIRKGYYIYRHRPMTLTLWVDWKAGIKL